MAPHSSAGMWRRGLLLLLVPVSVLAMVPAAMDPVSLPKVTAGAALMGLIVASAVWGLSRGEAVDLPRGPAAWVAFGFLGALVVSAGVAGFRASAVLGQPGRGSGLLLYAGAIAVYLALIAVAERRLLEQLLVVLLATGLVLAAIGFFQLSGGVLFGVRGPGSRVFGTLGNSNFFSAYVGALLPLALWLSADSERSMGARSVGVAAALAFIAAAILSRAFQGVVAAAAGAAVFALFAWTDPGAGRGSRYALTGLGVVALAGLVALGTGLAGTGPLAGAVGAEALQFRLWYWEAALGMFGDHPLLGVGLDQYAGYFRQYRPIEAFEAAGVADAADAAHSVPLSMVANGGLVLGVGYLAVVTLVVVAGVSGFRALEGGARRLLGAFAGLWIAYQVQSLVSLDVPALVYLHWFAAAGIVVLGAPWPITRAVRLIGQRKGSSGQRVARLLGHPRTASGFAVAAIVIAVGVVWGTARLTRADMAAGESRSYAAVDRYETAIERMDRAVELVPQQAAYRATRGGYQLRVGGAEAGLRDYLEAIDREPRGFALTVTAARLAASLEKEDLAASLYDRATVLEPNSAAIAAEAAEFFLKIGEEGRARALVDRALALAPGDERVRDVAEAVGVSE